MTLATSDSKFGPPAMTYGALPGMYRSRSMRAGARTVRDSDAQVVAWLACS